MRFCWSTVKVGDIERSLGFYEGFLGLRLVRRFASPSGEIAFLEGGAAEVELIADPEGVCPGSGQTLGFETDSLEDAVRLAGDMGIRITAGPIRAGPATRFFFVEDPDGYGVQIVQNG